MNQSGNDLESLRMAHLRRLRSPVLFSLYLLARIPSAFFMGIRLNSCTEQEAAVALPFWWMTKNPFRSVYFAAQCAAAELSTGVLATIAIQGMGPIKMLVANFEMEFVQKATSRVIFRCTEGETMQQAVQEAVRTKAKQTVRVFTEGRDRNGAVVSKAWVTWYFRSNS